MIDPASQLPVSLFRISLNMSPHRALSVILLFVALSAAGQSDMRIITAGSAITETVCALGDCDKIVATDRTSLYPAHVQNLPSIGYRSGISAEGIISLRPTLVIAEHGYVEEAVLRQLRSTGIPLVIVNERLNFDDTKKSIMQIASALEREEEGRALIARNESQLSAARARLAQSASKPRVLCVFNRGTATVSVAGTDTFAEILDYVGATNALANVEGYKPLNTEALIASNPDFLLLTSSGLQSIGGVDGALKLPGVAQTNAGKKRQIIGIETLKLTNFGPRFGETVKELVELLHPEITKSK